MITQLTANLAVETIEPTMEFFRKVGFDVTVQVPETVHGKERMGFCIMVKNDQQIMLQTHNSIIGDTPEMEAATKAGPALIFITTPDVKECANALDGYEIIMTWRESFYGATEIGYREPGGHFITFAQFAPEE